MSKDEIHKLLKTFEVGSGYGDPEERRNAELKLNALIAGEIIKTSTKLNWLTFCLVVVGLLNVAVLAFQVWGK
jgi:hypothetical protein